MDDQSYHVGSQAVIPYGNGFLHVLEGGEVGSVWNFVGGSYNLELDNNLADTARREAWEEISSRISVEGLVGIYLMDAEIYEKPVKSFVWACELLDGEEPSVRDGDTVMSIDSFSPDDYLDRDMRHSRLDQVIQDHLSKDGPYFRDFRD